jgi:hypothetical protein
MSERPARWTLAAASLGANGIEFNGGELASGLAEAHADPDGGVTAGRPDFKDLPGVGRADEHAQEPAILFGHGQLPLVGRPDARQEPGDRGLHRGRRGGLGGEGTDCEGQKGGGNARTSSFSQRHPSILGRGPML